MIETSSRQQLVLQALDAFIHERGYAPSFRELGARAGIASTSMVSFYVRSLARRGLVAFEPGKARSLRVTGGR